MLSLSRAEVGGVGSERSPSRLIVGDGSSPVLTRKVIAGATKRAHLPSHKTSQRGEEHEHQRAHHPSQYPHWHYRRHVRRTSPGGDAAARSLYDRGLEDGLQQSSPERVMARIPLITTPDVTGYWPRTTRPVRGPKEYAQRIVDLLAFIPDFRAELVKHATNGDIMFLRWVAMGTGPDGRFEAVGVDRLIVPNGYVAENLILSDHPIFAVIARHVGDIRAE